jgi:hypothetical protein
MRFAPHIPPLRADTTAVEAARIFFFLERNSFFPPPAIC